jgi:hypothetical protein
MVNTPENWAFGKNGSTINYIQILARGGNQLLHCLLDK